MCYGFNSALQLFLPWNTNISVGSDTDRAMSQHTCPCTPPPRTAESGLFFRIDVWCYSKNVLKGKLEYIIKLFTFEETKIMFFCIYTQIQF